MDLPLISSPRLSRTTRDVRVEPVLTYPAAEAYHQLKRKNHEPIDMLP